MWKTCDRVERGKHVAAWGGSCGLLLLLWDKIGFTSCQFRSMIYEVTPCPHSQHRAPCFCHRKPSRRSDKGVLGAVAPGDSAAPAPPQSLPAPAPLPGPKDNSWKPDWEGKSLPWAPSLTTEASIGDPTPCSLGEQGFEHQP